MSGALERLLEILDIEEIDENIYRGQNEHPKMPRLFGGQVAAQALMAAGRTVADRRAHSLHAYFLKAGDPSVPIVFTVDRIRDGASFTTRRVVAQQRGEAIFNTSISFHREESGFEHWDEIPEEAEDPDTLPTFEERAAQAGDKIPKEARAWLSQPRAIDMRSQGGMTLFGESAGRRTNFIWMRANGRVPDDPFVHQCILTYASDHSLLDNMIRRHVKGFSYGTVMMASLDHAVWFHRGFDANDWLLYTQDSPSAGGARGFARGTIYDRGRLVASVAQEGLMRPIEKRSKGSAKGADGKPGRAASK